MPSHLCLVCRAIPYDFWSKVHDQKEYSQQACVPLQSLECMRGEAADGCQLCEILFESTNEVQDQDSCIYLQRSHSAPHHIFTLKIGMNGDPISQAFFYRVPLWWCELFVSLQKQKHTPMERNLPVEIHEHVDNIRTMRSWLNRCLHKHLNCSSLQKDFLPTRLLDMQAFKTEQDIQLVDSQDVKIPGDAEYLTLSHCWGPPAKHSVKTEGRNLKARMTRISINDLSNTFRDAVRITRELGHRYLWIDSLCIIQDDKEDWAREAALMADVYGNATCTLAALSSEDGTKGCNIISDIQRSTCCSFLDLEVEFDRYSRLRIFQDEPANWVTEYGETPDQESEEKSPLRFRAWTLQESALSRRIVYFAKTQLLWQCREFKATAQLPWVEKRLEGESNLTPWPLDAYMTPGGPVSHSERWYRLVEDYSLRTLTYATDKLPALSGLAKGYVGGGQYGAGIWGAHFPGALLWQTTDEHACRHPPEDYIAPSWSWASTSGRVSYDSQRLKPFEQRFEGLSAELGIPYADFGFLKVDRIDVSPKYDDVYGAITSASLIMSGAQTICVDCPTSNKGAKTSVCCFTISAGSH
ncbi:HET-domain-containing protein [Dothidotthia symphoricarpi CBS 119687]|uniref:HET-domain-containing protein n=1 Tax=Dothidotthia symphoricarpi CBS 119687 TaxID=1392245 RepID=A0A6A6A4H1_9PLEO|nr:HET-domain-containing protein [Dothidotthia symphoricarpi CBS 119687]KAF2126053.1 HET-domain-containing protein [Dothidotthia symphoricarpi CBS 119687]